MLKHPTNSPFSFFLHALLSIGAGAFVAGLTAAIQLVGSGTASVSALLLAGFSAFSTYFGAGFVMLEKSPDAKAALGQAGQEVLARVDQLQQSHGTLISRIEAALVGLRQVAGATAQPPVQAQPSQIAPTVAVPVPQSIPAVQAPAQVAQQPFPAPLNWTGIVPSVPAQQ